MTPVEATMTSFAGHPTTSPTIRAVARALSSPTEPVAAFAAPELTTRARAVPYETPSRCSRETVTGAAQKTFCVNVAAHEAGSSATTSAMSRRFGSALKPAWTPEALKPLALDTPPPSMKVKPSNASEHSGLYSGSISTVSSFVMLVLQPLAPTPEWRWSANHTSRAIRTRCSHIESPDLQRPCQHYRWRMWQR